MKHVGSSWVLLVIVADTSALCVAERPQQVPKYRIPCVHVTISAMWYFPSSIYSAKCTVRWTDTFCGVYSMVKNPGSKAVRDKEGSLINIDIMATLCIDLQVTGCGC